MKYFIVIGISVFVMLTGLTIFLLARHVENKTLDALQQIGFKNVSSEDVHKSFGDITFINTSFDDDKVSTIKRLKSSLNANNKIVAKAHGLEIVSEFENGRLVIDGFQHSNFPYNLNYTDIKSINLFDASLSVLTDVFGGITFDGEGHIKREDKSLAFSIRTDSAQKRFSVKSIITGNISNNLWSAEGEIEQARIAISKINTSITRANGKFTANQTRGQPAELFIQMRAGGMTLFGLPWQNASITYETKPKHNQLFITGDSLNPQGIELSLTGVDNSLSSDIHAPDGETLIQFLTRINKLFLLNDARAVKKVTTPITLNISYYGEQTFDVEVWDEKQKVIDQAVRRISTILK